MVSTVTAASPALRTLLCFVLLLASRCSFALAQEAARNLAAGAVEEVEPRTIYLKDEKGNLVPVPGITYERFRDLLLLERREGNEAPPDFTVEKVSISGDLQSEKAECLAEFRIAPRRASWLQIPLRMANFQLHGEIQIADKLEMVHRYETKAGHTVWIKFESDSPTTLKMPLASRIKRSGSEYILNIDLPIANDAALSLQASEKISDISLTAGEGILEKSAVQSGKEIKIVAASGDVQVRWLSANEQTARANREIEVSTNISARVESRDVVTLTADLQLKRTSRKIDHAFVRIPPKFEPVLSGSEGIKITPATPEELSQLQPSGGNKKLTAGSVLRIDFTSLAETQRLFISADYKPEDLKRSPLDIGGFEVLGAGRQTGQISLWSQQGWSVKTTPDANVLRMDEPNLESLAEARGAVKYRFVKQPFALKLDIQPQATKTTVETLHAARVTLQSVRLLSTLQFRVRGPRPEFIDIDPADWQLILASPNDEVAVEGTAEAGKPLRLKLQAGTQEEFLVQLEWRKEIPENGMFSCELPRCLAAQLFPAWLCVEHAENVSLLPQLEAMRFLALDEKPISSFATLPEQAELFYRELPAGNEKARFVTRVSRRERKITASASGRIEFSAEQARIEQKLRFQVDYEPLESLDLVWSAPQPLRDLQILQGEQWLSWESMSDSASSPESIAGQPATTPSSMLRIALPTPLLGNQEIICRYVFPIVAGEPLSIPLLLPPETEQLKVVEQDLSWSSQNALGWEALHTTNEFTSFSRPTKLTWSRPVANMAFRPSAASVQTLPGIQIERAWLQIWLTSQERRDRFTAIFQTTQPTIELRLPPQATFANTRVLLNGAAAQVNWQHDRLSVAIPHSKPQRLELWYLVPHRLSERMTHSESFPLPGFAGAYEPRQFYLQLKTPLTHQLLNTPAGFTAFNVWRKRSWWWEQVGQLSTTELEQLFGAPSRDELEPPAKDTLLFTLGSPETIEITWGLTRWLRIVSIASVLCGGWLLWWFTRGERLAWLLAIGIILLGMAFLLPELTLSISQSLAWGFLLLAGSLWSWRWQRPTAQSRSTLPTAYRSNSPSHASRSTPTSTVALALQERRS